MEGTTTIATAATVALALLVVAKTRTVGLTEATGNSVQNTPASIGSMIARASAVTSLDTPSALWESKTECMPISDDITDNLTVAVDTDLDKAKALRRLFKCPRS